MLGVFSKRFAVFMTFFFIRDIISLNVNLHFKRNETFKDLLPSTAYVSYIETKKQRMTLVCSNVLEAVYIVPDFYITVS